MSVETIRLRACEPEDLELLYRWENDPAYWCGDELRTPYSRYVLKQFILRAGQSVYESRQMRFMAVREADGLTVGDTYLGIDEGVSFTVTDGVLVCALDLTLTEPIPEADGGAGGEPELMETLNLDLEVR